LQDTYNYNICFIVQPFSLKNNTKLFPFDSSAFLRRRRWISSHLHMVAPLRVLASVGRSEARLAERFAREPSAPGVHSDFSRLGRHITGQSVGLVLGGGGKSIFIFLLMLLHFNYDAFKFH